MAPFRLLMLRYRTLAACLIAVTLAMRLLVPGGYMIGGEHGRLTIELCSGVAEQPMAAMPDMHGGTAGHGTSKDHGKAEMPCPFSGLSAAALDAVDPVRLAALLAFILAMGLCAVPSAPPHRRSYTRPPLRGPPLPF